MVDQTKNMWTIGWQKKTEKENINKSNVLIFLELFE